MVNAGISVILKMSIETNMLHEGDRRFIARNDDPMSSNHQEHEEKKNQIPNSQNRKRPSQFQLEYRSLFFTPIYINVFANDIITSRKESEFMGNFGTHHPSGFYFHNVRPE